MRERRRYIRQPVQLEAAITARRGTRHAGMIEDFCPGGLFVRCEELAKPPPGQKRQVAPEDRIRVDFSLPYRGRHKIFELEARVAGLFKGGLGLQFIDPDPDAVDALQVLADQTNKTRKASFRAEVSDEDTRAPRTVSEAPRILARFRGIVNDFVSRQLEGLFEKARQTLFSAARDAGSNAEEREYFEALQEIENVRSTVESSFRDDIVRQLDELGKVQGVGGESEDREAMSDLSLVDTQSFNDWLEIKKLLEKAKPRHQESCYKVERRLSHLLRLPVDEQNNPVGPTSICSAYHDALQNLGVSRPGRAALFRSLGRTVIGNLGNLYDELNELFERSEVLPGLEMPAPKPPHQPRSESPRRERAAEEATHADTQQWADTATGRWGETESGRWADTRSAHRAAAAPQRGAGPAQPLAQQGPAPSPAAVGDYGFVVQQAYQTARNLLDLQRHLASAAPAGGERGEPGTLPAPAAGAFRVDEIFDFLTKLQREDSNRPVDETTRFDLRSRVLGGLDAAQKDEDETKRKEVGPGERDAIEVVGALINSILEDPSVDDGAKARVGKLSVPLLKVALQDPSFFDNEDHPARQVVNQLGRVELSAGDPGETTRFRLRRSVDPLIRRVLTEYEDDPRVFDDVRNELDRLAHDREQEYTQNVAEVIKSCEAQQALIQELRRESGTDTAEHRKPADVPAEWKRWLERAKSLELGNVLMLDQDMPEPKRAHLAWVGEDPKTYVFVNSEGRKTASLSPSELAMQLRRGSAKVLDDADLPIMERGLFGMLTGMHENLVQKATHDRLTGLLNRREFEERLRQALTASLRDQKKHVLCHLDLDGFKVINEACSRRAGDRLLAQLGRVLKKHVGSKGVVGRFDGDDFVILLLDCSEEQGQRLAERQRVAIEQSRCVYKGQTFSLTASIGLVPVTAESASAADLLDTAAAACETAKEGGGNRIQVEQVSDVEDTFHFAGEEWAERIRKALHENLLSLRGQRIVSTIPDESEKTHWEILLSSRDDDGQPGAPAEFIREAERANQMPAVDRWVIRKTLQWMAENRKTIMKLGGLAINLSGHTLSDDKLIGYVIEQFTETKVPPAKVVFEITESAAIENLSNAQNFIKVMKDYGCRFALDDFGTGHSSYSYLRNLPVDYLKIDGMFVKDIVDNPTDFAMVKSINEIGHFMGKKTVAEYVENDQILAKLREIGVDYVQGFGIAEPFFLDEKH
ncbi:MAG: DUF1631 family protein [Gammaproteobacteria bacterium]|nr:DUF1631 family protein [Gammaproteobacteria bacterium]NIR81952.1 DUF1631 family protein [Gammaproteobacteria bacterium]NIR89004.1 DUF1631 family protein [Gammaproteobacteria bacterium]NIU03059.1 DUF1631 family protein [Gammaproteobacteria bacterium]NIV50583.1 DUF1631 family protein [Gammaproteobacteria bacterium]